MTEERYKWYQAEIARLKDIDKRISDRVRATYSLDKNKSGLLIYNMKSNTDIQNTIEKNQ